MLVNDLIITFLQVLADVVNLPCRIAKGCKYCGRELASSCLVRFDNDRYVYLGFFKFTETDEVPMGNELRGGLQATM